MPEEGKNNNNQKLESVRQQIRGKNFNLKIVYYKDRAVHPSTIFHKPTRSSKNVFMGKRCISVATTEATSLATARGELSEHTEGIRTASRHFGLRAQMLEASGYEMM